MALSMAAAQVAGEVRVSDLEAPAGYGYNGYGWLGRVWVSPLIHLPAFSPTITVSRSAVGVSYRRRGSAMRKTSLAKTSCLRQSVTKTSKIPPDDKGILFNPFPQIYCILFCHTILN